MIDTLRATLALVALAVCAPAHAASSQDSLLPDIQASRLPSLADSTAPTLFNVAGRAVIIDAAGAWILSPDLRTWNRTTRPVGLDGWIARSAGGGEHAFAFLSRRANSEVGRVARLSLRGDTLAAELLPASPYPLSDARGAVAGESLFVAGLDARGTPRFLEFQSTGDAGHWSEHPAWPGDGVPTSLAAQLRALHLTVSAAGTTKERLLRWSQGKGWEIRGETPGPVVEDSGHALGQAHVLYLVGSEDTAATLTSYHAISDSWVSLPWKAQGPVASVAPWARGIVALTAGAGPVVAEAVELRSSRTFLTWIDWTTIALYLVAMVGIGLYFHLRGKENSASEFFLGSRSIPVWAAGVSLYATNTSSISYIAIPAKSFETNWQYLSNNLVTVLGLMFVATWVVPLLRRLDLVSVFSYLEMRFNAGIRMLASALCLCMQVGGRMSVVLFLPALALAAITGIDVTLSILLMGICTIVYTALGGMRAVIWTDFIQVFVMFGGALFAIAFVVNTIGGEQLWQTAQAHDKTRLLDFSFDLTQATIWGFFVLTLLDVVLTFPKDQVLMQRALATKSDKSAGKSIWLFAAMTIPGGFIFYGIGTALFAYYQARPERLDPLLPIDATFPLFIAAELPPGATGLIIAGIFAAAMSTLSSTINSAATLLTVDFYNRFRRNPTQAESLRFAEWMTVVVGIVGIALALLLSRYEIHSLLDTTIELTGLLGGGFAGAYTLGMFTRRTNSAGVSIGIAAAIGTTLFAWSIDLVHPYFYLGISIAVCIVVGYLASLMFPAPERSLAGLTIVADEDPGGTSRSTLSS